MKTKLLIFGVAGDLSTRKLLPALSAIVATGEFDDLVIYGVSRREVDLAELLQRSTGGTDLLDRMSLVAVNLVDTEDYRRLKTRISLGADEQLVVYLSVPPMAATQIVNFLGQVGLNTPNVKILFEKPFGVDLISAQDVIARTQKYYDEDQIYRIDHYLAKEMAQNIISFRGRNALFSHIWNNTCIQSIEIIASETIGIEGRTQFYEQTGALRDVVQGHLLQLLALILMDIPDDFDWQQLPQLRLRALQQLRVVDPAQVVRAQYDGYQEEVSNPGSQTETFVRLNMQSDHPHWQGVPIRLVTGKALHQKTTEICIHLKKLHDAQSNCITFNIQPNEGIHIDLFVKKPGYERRFETRTLGFDYPEHEQLPDAYEQVIVDAIGSHKSLFTSGDEVLRSWELLADVQRSWDMDNAPLVVYPKGARAENITGEAVSE